MAAKDVTSVARATKRIGSLKYFLKHKGTTKPNFGKASAAQIKKWQKQLDEELQLRAQLQKQHAATAKDVAAMEKATAK